MIMTMAMAINMIMIINRKILILLNLDAKKVMYAQCK